MSDGNYASWLEYVTKLFNVQGFCLTAFKLLPEELKTLEICLLAVQQDHETLQFVPEALKKEIRTAAKQAEGFICDEEEFELPALPTKAVDELNLSEFIWNSKNGFSYLCSN